MGDESNSAGDGAAGDINGDRAIRNEDSLYEVMLCCAVFKQSKGWKAKQIMGEMWEVRSKLW